MGLQKLPRTLTVVGAGVIGVEYASIFAAWDLVFGTAHLPRARDPLRYGTAERVPAGYVERLYHPFRRTPLAEHPQNPKPRKSSCSRNRSATCRSSSPYKNF